MEAIFGYAPDVWRWTPDFWLDRVHPDDRAEVERADEHSNAERTQFSLEYRFLAADGEWRWIHDEATSRTKLPRPFPPRDSSPNRRLPSATRKFHRHPA